ncbi:MAG: hypothetical protein Q7R39_11610 [Dehalococcoidia bacterium]|nr:hypothetical protein [Dehalococcoidia bacterium]
MEAKKKTSWELLGQIALSKSKTVELMRFLQGRAPSGARKLKTLRRRLSLSLPPDESLSQVVVQLREDRL